MATKTRRGLRVFGALALVGGLVGGAYYYLFARSRRPQFELYFDDGSMLAFRGDSAEATPFMQIAEQILESNPVSS